jgi:hypothetical protein
VTGAAETPNGLDRARQRVVAERQRASRAAEVATRHELLATTAQEELKQFHQNVATTHRQMEARHLVTAGIQAAHVERLRSWAQATPRGTELSTAASALTDSIADRDIGESFVSTTRSTHRSGYQTHFIERLGSIGFDDLGKRPEN